MCSWTLLWRRARSAQSGVSAGYFRMAGARHIIGHSFDIDRHARESGSAAHDHSLHAPETSLRSLAAAQTQRTPSASSRGAAEFRPIFISRVAHCRRGTVDALGPRKMWPTQTLLELPPHGLKAVELRQGDQHSQDIFELVLELGKVA